MESHSFLLLLLLLLLRLRLRLLLRLFLRLFLLFRFWGPGVLSFGYFSLHKQRKVTRSAGVKALDFDVDFAVKAFDRAFKSF